MNDQQLIHKLRKDVRILKSSILLLATAMAILWFAGFSPKMNQHFGEIDVERLNIVDSSGKYCFILTNGSRAPGAIIGGKELKRSNNSNNTPSILFFNGEGDESGALFTAGQKDNDSSYFGSSRLVFDRLRHDETIAFQYYEDQLGGYAGMLVQDTRDMTTAEYSDKRAVIEAMPESADKTEALNSLRAKAGPWATKRLFVGKYDRSKAAVVEMRDRKGNTRLLLNVDSIGVPRIEFLNEKGDVTFSLPDSITVK